MAIYRDGFWTILKQLQMLVSVQLQTGWPLLSLFPCIHYHSIPPLTQTVPKIARKCYLRLLFPPLQLVKVRRAADVSRKDKQGYYFIIMFCCPTS